MHTPGPSDLQEPWRRYLAHYNTCISCRSVDHQVARAQQLLHSFLTCGGKSQWIVLARETWWTSDPVIHIEGLQTDTRFKNAFFGILRWPPFRSSWTMPRKHSPVGIQIQQADDEVRLPKYAHMNLHKIFFAPLVSHRRNCKAIRDPYKHLPESLCTLSQTE